MSVYKEGYHAVQLIQSNSRQIWPDACDFGAPTKKDDVLWNWAKQLADWYGIKSTRKVTGLNVSKQADIYISLMDEWKTGKTEFFHLIYYKTPSIKGYDGFFEITKVTDSKLIAELTKAEEKQMAN